MLQTYIYTIYIHHICYILCTSQARRASASASSAASQDTVSFLILIIINLQSTAGLQEGESCLSLFPSLSRRGFLFLSLCCRLQPRFCLVFKLSRLFSLSNPPSSLPSFFSSLQVVLLLCKLRPQYTFSHTRKSQPPLLGMVALAIALPPPSVHEIRLECDMFVTRVNFDLRVAHCEPR